MSENRKTETLEALSKAISEHIMACYEGDEPLVEVYVSQWALVINMGDLKTGFADEYLVEFSTPNMPPHAMKGLFSEGIDEVDILRQGLGNDY